MKMKKLQFCKSLKKPLFIFVFVLNKAWIALQDGYEQWKNLTFLQKVLPWILMTAYVVGLILLNGLREDHVIAVGVILIASYSGPQGRKFLKFALPFLLTFMVYDSQRFYSDWIRGPIHVSEPYYFDRTFFGIPTNQGILTPNEWCQLHLTRALDLLTGFAYLTFFSIFILIAAYYNFYLSRKGTCKLTPAQVKQKASSMPWAFFWLNLIGYSTYYWYAAAPPWYVTKYGLGPARLDVPASSAGCIRFDEILGTHFFSEMYGRAADVFGAIPSLHVAYPLLAVFFAFQLGSLRVFCIFFYIWMCFSAVYLNHHYILDILWGSFYALLIGWLVYRLNQSQEDWKTEPQIIRQSNRKKNSRGNNT